MAPRNARAPWWPWLVLAALVVAIDQLSKMVVSRTMHLSESRRLTDWLNLVCWHNAGAAFSFLHDAGGWQRWAFVALAAIAVVFIVVMLVRHRAQRLFSAALALIMGGAIGNVIDRVVHGYVVDFIQLHYDSAAFPAFNAADSAITLGAVLLIADELTRVRRAR
jgi:signal peptidase II